MAALCQGSQALRGRTRPWGLVTGSGGHTREGQVQASSSNPAGSLDSPSPRKCVHWVLGAPDPCVLTAEQTRAVPGHPSCCPPCVAP